MERVSEAGLARHAAAQALAVQARARVASRMIDRKIDDAGAHAQKSLTETLKDTPDGRRTIAGVRRSRSYGAALSRLGELGAALADQIREAREEFLVQSWSYWAPILDQRDEGPPVALRRSIRSAALHGYTLADEIGARIDRSGRTLQAATVLAASREVGDRKAGAMIRSWEIRTKGTLMAGVLLLLSDSAVLADQVAAWYLVPESERPDVAPPL